MLCRGDRETGISRGWRSNKENIKRLGLPKIERLRGEKEIKRLFSAGKRFARSKLTVIYLPAVEQKAGFVASRQVGGAVKRNRMRRILREAYRMNKEIFRGLEIIFYAQGLLDLDEVVKIFKQFPAQQ